MDLLVGGYASVHLAQMTEDELELFEQLLEIPDQLLLAWVTQQEVVPPQLDCHMLRELLAFRPSDPRA